MKYKEHNYVLVWILKETQSIRGQGKGEAVCSITPLEVDSLRQRTPGCRVRVFAGSVHKSNVRDLVTERFRFTRPYWVPGGK